MITNKAEGSLFITFSAYLDELKAQEKQKPPGQRRDVPTIKDLAQAVGVHQVTLTNIASDNIDRLSLKVARAVLDEMWHRGFRPQLTDFMRYIPPEINHG